jgi:mRNA-degrading endonuclease toxin of MazEF toxin-antitoxin module
MRRLGVTKGRDMARLMTRGAIVAVAAASMAVAGCSFSVGSNQEKTVAKADVADQISAKVNEKAGHKPQSVSCPDDLKAAVGASLDCQMTDDGQTYGVNVTVTSVDGSKVNFDIVETVSKDDVAKSITEQLTQQFGRTPEITCPDDLKGELGATTRCQLTDQGATYGVTVTVNSVDGGDVKYGFKVDDQPEQG